MSLKDEIRWVHESDINDVTPDPERMKYYEALIPVKSLKAWAIQERSRNEWDAGYVLACKRLIQDLTGEA